jgi:nickel transport protein
MFGMGARTYASNHIVRIVVAVVVILSANAIDAHDVWITTIQDGTGALQAVVNHGHPGDRKVPDPDKLFELDFITGEQRRHSLLPGIKSTMLDGIPVLITEPLPKSLAGAVLLVAGRYDNGYWVKTPNGYRNTSKRQVPRAEESLYSMKFAKALFSTDSVAPHDYGTIIGHRLELVPLNDPFVMNLGEVLKVRVYFDGKPLPGIEVEAGDGVTPMDEKDIPRYRTDEEGIADVQIAKAGPQVLVVDYTLSSIHPDLANRELFNATLSFVLPTTAQGK